MDTKKSKKCYNDLLAEKLIEKFQERNFEAFYCHSKEDAVKKLLELIDRNGLISCGGSATIHEIRIKPVLKREGYHLLDPDDAQGAKEKDEVAHRALAADYFLMSANAISEGGELVNIDGYGNRVAALIFGPRNVIVIAGMNKVVPTVEAASVRGEDWAAGQTRRIFEQDCCSCAGLSVAAEAACSQMVITGSSMIKGRIKVILIGENLGF